MNAEINYNKIPKFEFDANEAKVCYEKARQQANLGKYTEALACLNLAVTIEPQDIVAWVFRAVVLIQLERYEEALTSCDRALKIQSTDKQAWIVKGAALNLLGRYKQCYACYDKALEIERHSVWQKLFQMLKGLRFGSLFGGTIYNS